MPEPDRKLENVHLTIEILRRIPRSRKISAPELQKQLKSAGFERSDRSIQRQLKAICHSFDIECDERNKPYGYRWKPHAHGLSLPVLSHQESLLLTLAEQHLKNLLPEPLMKSMGGFFLQARQNLEPANSAGPERDLLSKVRAVSTSQPLLPAEVDSKVFSAVSSALYADHMLKIHYQNAGGRLVSAQVMPLGLAQQGPMLYLVCRFEGFEDERSLALHRLIAAEETTLPFKRPKDFDLQKYDADGRFGFGEGERVRLSFRIDKEAGVHLLEAKLSDDQKVVELEDQYEITATVVDSAQLDWWLRGFGRCIGKIRKQSPMSSSVFESEELYEEDAKPSTSVAR